MASSTSDCSGRFVVQLILLLSSAPSSFSFLFISLHLLWWRRRGFVTLLCQLWWPWDLIKGTRRDMWGDNFLSLGHLLHANGLVLLLSYQHLRITPTA